ncbi:MAG: terminase small subunit [Weeksellaceae bacterium]|nr:terminase small subunit [Weeksellaceae bacterium]
MNQKQEKFCREYLIDLNATQAAVRAGYSEKTAYSIGGRLLKNVEIQNRISELQRDLQRASEITAIRILEELGQIAFSNIGDLYDNWTTLKDFESLTDAQRSCIKSINTKVTKRNVGSKLEPEIVDIEYVRVELFDKIKALDSIARILGLTDQAKPIEQDFKLRPLTKEEIEFLSLNNN